MRLDSDESSGSGGQHVNKVASKVVLYFNIENSIVFNEDEKNRLRDFFSSRLSKQGVLILSSEESRSQFRNKALVTQRFLSLIVSRATYFYMYIFFLFIYFC